MRIIFMGTPDFAVPTLRSLAAAGHEIACVYSRAPKPGGRRGLEIVKTPVHRLADELGVDVRTPRTLRDAEEQTAFRTLNADAAVVVAYGLILPPEILAGVKFGCFNLHASLLPRWRGAAPIQRAIMAGDAETGVSVMRMEAGLDTGPIALETRVAIDPHATSGDLAVVLAERGGGIMREALEALGAGALEFHPQSEAGVTYARKIDKAEAAIDWRASAETIRAQVHGLSPAPGAYGEIEAAGKLERIKFLRIETVEGSGAPGEVVDASPTIACGAGAIRVLEAQRAGKTAMSGAALARGAILTSGTRFRTAAEGSVGPV